jgi:pimeloyl-ACP methyl ester carboxylesterase
MTFPHYLKSKFLIIPLGIIVTLLYFAWKQWALSHFESSSQKINVAEQSLLPGNYFEASIPPPKEAQYSSADYRIWIPSNTKKIRGLIIKQHGCGDPAAASGMNHAKDLQWQALALKHQFALIGTKLPSGNKPCESWALINYGSGKAFLKALNALAEKSQHSELENAPWVLWGHSGGADWAAQMLQEYPERTIAMVAARCGGFTFFGVNPKLADIPVLFSLGENEPTEDECLNLPQKVFTRYRKTGALWAVAVGNKTGHETGDTRFLAIPYLDEIITKRLPAQGNQLRPIKAAQGWLGNPRTQEIAPVDSYTGDSFKAAWLPNEDIAKKWQGYVKTGKVPPTQKPAAPSNVRAATIHPTEVTIKWDFTPDLENGLPSFNIYRNNTLIATIKGQDHNFGDSPKLQGIALEFRDKYMKGSTKYNISAVNELGESKSESTLVKNQ